MIASFGGLDSPLLIDPLYLSIKYNPDGLLTTLIATVILPAISGLVFTDEYFEKAL